MSSMQCWSQPRGGRRGTFRQLSFHTAGSWIHLLVVTTMTVVHIILVASPVHSFQNAQIKSLHQRRREGVDVSFSLPVVEAIQLDADIELNQLRERKNPLFGGSLKRIKLEGQNDDDDDQTFLGTLAVPTYAAFPDTTSRAETVATTANTMVSRRLGLEALVPGAFVVENVLSIQDCNKMIQMCEDAGFGNFRAGKNHHGAMQVVVTPEVSHSVASELARHVDLSQVSEMDLEKYVNPKASGGRKELVMVGLNRRWRIYRYEPGGEETFAPHIDAGFPPSGLSEDGTTLMWDSGQMHDKTKVMSRLTVLMYLNDDFDGGQTKFYAPRATGTDGSDTLIASVQPKAGAVLVFPQAVGEDQVEHAREHWPLHEGSPVHKGERPKYVIRSDILFADISESFQEDEDDQLFRYDPFVRQAFLPRSPVWNSRFLDHVRSLYNPHMGVENIGPLLYSLVRFTKVRKVVEIGAGYTSVWILQALKDNDDEMRAVAQLQHDGKAMLLNWPWTVTPVVEQYCDDNFKKSSLLCVDNCLHQKETATGAAAVAKTLNLDSYFEFIQGDAFNMEFEPASVDMLWCDFGVGSRMADFCPSAWSSIRPGGFLVCHSTLTNLRTRTWLDAVRARAPESETGLPPDEFVELSLLEPHKHYQNSVTILQRRSGPSKDDDGKEPYVEPVFSEYA